MIHFARCGAMFTVQLSHAYILLATQVSGPCTGLLERTLERFDIQFIQNQYDQGNVCLRTTAL